MATNLEPNNFDEPINELEAALKSFISLYNIDLIENRTNHEQSKKGQIAINEQIKTNIEQSAEQLYEKAHNLETIFLRSRLDISKKAPESLIIEEIECLKAELKRKEDLLNDSKEKLAHCENALRGFSNSLDHHLNIRLEMTTHNYLPNENLAFPGISMHPGPVQPNMSQDQSASGDNGVILIQ